MIGETAGKIQSLYYYPVKGLGGQRLATVELAAGQTMPYDRAYAIENGGGRFDPLAPEHLQKLNFLMLMRNEKLASLEVDFEIDEHVLRLSRNGKLVTRGSLRAQIGRTMIEQFIAAYMKADLRGAPKIVHAEGHHFADLSRKCIHLVNIATVRDLGRIAGQDIDPLRFRANVYVDGLPAWSELGWIDREIILDGVKCKVFARTDRCAAINVHPGTGARDMGLPSLLQRSQGHQDVGIYARILQDGAVCEGGAIEVPA